MSFYIKFKILCITSWYSCLHCLYISRYMKCVNFINCWFISILSLLQPLNNGTPGRCYMLTPLYGVLCVFPAEFPSLLNPQY